LYYYYLPLTIEQPPVNTNELASNALSFNSHKPMDVSNASTIVWILLPTSNGLKSGSKHLYLISPILN